MAKYRKLGRTSDQRKALLRSQVTALINNGRITTTEARAKEVKKIAEGIIALAVKEKDNYDTVEVDAKIPEKDKDGKRVKDSEGKTQFTVVKKTIKKDNPRRLTFMTRSRKRSREIFLQDFTHVVRCSRFFMM